MLAVTHPVGTSTHVAGLSGLKHTGWHWRTVLTWFAACIIFPLGLAACGGSDSAPPITSVSALIDATGGTVNGPDGLQVVIPAGALSQPTTIGIARSAAGAPPTPEAFPVAGYVYELTPHGLTFNNLVTVRAPLPSGATTPLVFMASAGEGWKFLEDAQLVNGMAEWQRNSFSNLMMGSACVVPLSMVNDPYWCRWASSGARVTATPPQALVQTSVGDPIRGDAGSYRVDQSTTLQFKTTFGVAGNCSNVTTTLKRFPYEGSATRTWGTPVIIQTKTPALTVVGGILRGVETFDFAFDYQSKLAGPNLFSIVVNFNCPGLTHSGGTVTGWDYGNPRSEYVGDGMIVTGNVPAPTVFFNVGGSVSGLTGTGLVLQNSGGDNLAIAANATTFTFATPAGAGAPYAVTVLTQPTGQTCTVANSSGTASANVTNVAVNCVTVLATKAWQGAALIETNNAGGAESPEIAFDANGNAFAIWFQWDGTRYDIWANRYTPTGGWQTPQLLESGSDHATAPHIALDASGNAIAVWQQTDGSVYSIWANRYSGGAWGTAQLIETDAGQAFSPRIAFDASGNALAVWSQNVGALSRIRNNRFVSGAWGSATTIDGGVGSAFQPQLAVFPGGSAVAVWIQTESGFDHIFSNTFNGTVWSTANVLDSNNNGGMEAPQLAADANGNAITVWSQRDGVNLSVYTSRFSAGNWGLVELLETSNVSIANAPQIAMNPAGDAMAVWLEDQSDDTNPWARRYTAGVGWGSPVQLDNSNRAGRPNVAIDLAGNAMAVWVSSGDLYVNRYVAGTGWGTPGVLEISTGNISYGNVAMDANGNAIAAWSQSDGTRPNIWANVYK